MVPAPGEVLIDQIQDGGEGAELVLLLDMKLEALFVHARSMPQAR